MKKKTTLAIVHPQIRWGGGEAVTFWAIQSLRDEYDITLITFDEFNLTTVNTFYGVELKPGDFEILRIPLPAALKLGQQGWLIKQHLAMRYVKKVRNLFDTIFGTFNEMDFGRPGIQYIHFPVLAEEALKAMGFIDFANKWYYKSRFFRKAYRRFCEALSGFSLEDVKGNLTLVNSQWTGGLVEKIYGIKPRVVYPPVKSDFPFVPWGDREKGFVCLGRISPEKRIETVITILREIRELGSDVHLHLIGRIEENEYGEKIKQLIAENSSWIALEENITRERLVQLLIHHKFGIHGMKNEHFGIAVAEMVKAGMIVFVPNGGGQVEIVSHEELIYNDEADAIAKIYQVLNNPELQATLREHLKKRAILFSETSFMRQIRDIVADFMEGKI